NDLDAETLEMLEARLVEYSGTVLLVSHDREFLNNVVTSTIVFEPQGAREYDGGYDDWLAQRSDVVGKAPSKKEKRTKEKAKAESSPAKRKLSYKEQRELESLPQVIEKLETAAAAMHQAMAAPDFYQRASDQIAADQEKLNEIEANLAETFTRWEELESLFVG
ncbi:MAG: ABC transporter ATP-binding protein, partial [Planctomycetales bacterium]